MPITTNESGTLYVLDTVTANEGGMMYELDTVYSNEGGMRYEIHSAWKSPSISWYEKCIFNSLNSWSLSTASNADYIAPNGLFLVENRDDTPQYNYGEFTVTKPTVITYTITRNTSNYSSNVINGTLYYSIENTDPIDLVPAGYEHKKSYTGTITLSPGKYLISVYASGGGESGSSGGNAYQISVKFAKA